MTWITFRRLHEDAVDCAVNGSLLHSVVILREFASNINLLTPINAALLMATAAILLGQRPFFVVRSSIVQS